VSEIAFTRMKLAQWARYCRGRARTGYPTSAAFIHAGEGDRAHDDLSEMPPDLSEIDRIIARLAELYRVPLVVYYLGRAALEVKAARLRISRRTLMRRVATAERQVHLMLMSCTCPESVQ